MEDNSDYEYIELLLPSVDHLANSLAPSEHPQINNPKQKKGLRKDQIEELYYDLGRLIHSWLEIASAGGQEVVLIAGSSAGSVGSKRRGVKGSREEEEEEALEEIMRHHTSHPREEQLSKFIQTFSSSQPDRKDVKGTQNEGEVVRGWEEVLVLLGYVGELEGERIADGSGWGFGL